MDWSRGNVHLAIAVPRLKVNQFKECLMLQRNNPQVLQRALNAMLHRAQLYIQVTADHFEHIAASEMSYLILKHKS